MCRGDLNGEQGSANSRGEKSKDPSGHTHPPNPLLSWLRISDL